MTKDLVNDWVSNARGADYGFFKAIVWALEQFEQKNNRPLYAMIAISNGKKFGNYKIIEGERLAYASPIRRILKVTLPNTIFVFKDGQAKVSLVKGANGHTVSDDHMQALRMLAAQNVTVRNSAFKDAFPVEPKVTKRDADSVSKAVTKLLKDNDLQLGDIIELVRAAMVLTKE